MNLSFLVGSNGVNLFFALSGFLITLILIKTKETAAFSLGPSLRNFYIRRILRIFPVYYLMLILLWFLNHKLVADGMPWYLSYLTNFYCIKIQGWGGLSHLWSLALEEQFYLIWPFIIFLTPVRKVWIPIVAIILISVSGKLFLQQNGANFWTLYMNPIGVFDILGLGALLAYGYHFHVDKLKSLLYNIPIIAIVFTQYILCALCRKNGQYDFIFTVFSRFSFGLLAIWIIGRAAIGFTGVIGAFLLLSPLRYIGRISYSVYLFHLIIPGMLLGIKYPTDVWLRFFMYLAVTLAISSISWYFFEKKILKLKDRFEY